MDYHFQRSVLYFTTNSTGTGSLERLDMMAMTDADGRITLMAQGTHNVGIGVVALVVCLLLCFVLLLCIVVPLFSVVMCCILWCHCFLL